MDGPDSKRMRLSSPKVELTLIDIQQWNLPTTSIQVFAAQFKQSLIYLGVVQKEKDKTYEYVLNGFSATPSGDNEGNYVWFTMPEFYIGTGKLPNLSILKSAVITKHGVEMIYGKNTLLMLDLLDPSQQWKKCISEEHVSKNFTLLQEHPQYRVEASIHAINVTDKVKGVTNQFKYAANFQCTHTIILEHMKSAIVADHLYVIAENKMAVIPKLDQLTGSDDQSEDILEFDVVMPHHDSTPFAVQKTLFTVGGYEGNFEPSSDIYQYDRDTSKWKLYGLAEVPRYKAEVVIFKGKNDKESVFVVGGFKECNTPCRAVERIPVTATDY